MLIRFFRTLHGLRIRIAVKRGTMKKRYVIYGILCHYGLFCRMYMYIIKYSLRFYNSRFIIQINKKNLWSVSKWI